MSFVIVTAAPTVTPSASALVPLSSGREEMSMKTSVVVSLPYGPVLVLPTTSAVLLPAAAAAARVASSSAIEETRSQVASGATTERLGLLADACFSRVAGGGFSLDALYGSNLVEKFVMSVRSEAWPSRAKVCAAVMIGR